jgi:hypothetical protein
MMFVSRFNIARIGVTLALTAAAVTFLTPPVAAQAPRIPPDARGYQTYLLRQEARQAVHSAPAPVAQRSTTPHYSSSPNTGVYVGVNVPTPTGSTPAPTTYVTIRGPDGKVRRFPLASGVEVQYSREAVTLRPGESATIRLIPR